MEQMEDLKTLFVFLVLFVPKQFKSAISALKICSESSYTKNWTSCCFGTGHLTLTLPLGLLCACCMGTPRDSLLLAERY